MDKVDEKEIELAKKIIEEWNGYTWESAIKEAKSILESNRKYKIASNYYR